MVWQLPEKIKLFCESIRGSLSKPQFSNVVMILSGILFSSGRRSLAQFGRTVAEHQRYRGTVSRNLRNKIFRTRDLYREAALFVLGLVLNHSVRRSKPRWFLCIDGVSTKRGAFTKIANALQFKSKSPKRRGVGTKALTFVMGMVITHRGERIPVPRKTYRTKAYARSIKKPYKTQQDLAAEMIRETRNMIPSCIELTVLLDSYFEGKKLLKCCEKNGVTFIVPVDSRRCFADPKYVSRSNGKSIVNRARRLSGDSWEKVTLVSGSEDTACYRRYSTRERAKAKRRHYRVARETRAVASLGEVSVVYSWKNPVYRSNGLVKKESLKVLLTNDFGLSAAEVVEFYEIRWQIELLFRELKSDLGLGDYWGTDFQAFERHVDLVLLAFLCLEWLRTKYGDGRYRRTLDDQRTVGLVSLLRREVIKDDLKWLSGELLSVRRRRKSSIYLDNLIESLVPEVQLN